MRGGYLYMATSGYLVLATRGYFFMATDTGSNRRVRESAAEVAEMSTRTQFEGVDGPWACALAN